MPRMLSKDRREQECRQDVSAEPPLFTSIKQFCFRRRKGDLCARLKIATNTLCREEFSPDYSPTSLWLFPPEAWGLRPRLPVAAQTSQTEIPTTTALTFLRRSEDYSNL